MDNLNDTYKDIPKEVLENALEERIRDIPNIMKMFHNIRDTENKEK